VKYYNSGGGGGVGSVVLCTFSFHIMEKKSQIKKPLAHTQQQLLL